MDLLSVLVSCSLIKHYAGALQPSPLWGLPTHLRSVQGSPAAAAVPCLSFRLPACDCLAAISPLLLLVEVSTINSHLILLWRGQDGERRRGFSGKEGSMGGPESSGQS